MPHDQERQRYIQNRAYALWEREGRPEGRHLHHWVIAEQQINAEAAALPARFRVVSSTGEPVATKPRRRKPATADSPSAKRNARKTRSSDL